MKIPPYRILVVDEHKIVRQALCSLLEHGEGFLVVGDADGATALAKAINLNPDVILMDPRTPEVEDGMRVLTLLRENLPNARVVILTAQSHDTDLVYRAIRGGAVGCVLKTSGDIDEVIASIRNVAQGGVFLSSSALTSLMEFIASQTDRLPNDTSGSVTDNLGSGNELSPRESEVLDLVAQGHSNREIAERLVISESTVRSHLQHILDKLQLTNRVQAAAFALQRRKKPSPRNPLQISGLNRSER